MTTTWNPSDKSSGITLSGGDLTATGDGSSFGNIGVRATNPVAAGSGRKVFMSFESLLLQNGDDHIGITNENWTLGDSSGAGAVVFQYGGSSAFQGAFGTPSGFSPSGKILDVALDTVARKIWFREDGGDWNNNPSADPAAGTGADAWTDPAAASPAYSNYFIAARLRTNGDFATINTTGPFTYSIPAGFTAWDESAEELTADMESGLDMAAALIHREPIVVDMESGVDMAATITHEEPTEHIAAAPAVGVNMIVFLKHMEESSESEPGEALPPVSVVVVTM